MGSIVTPSFLKQKARQLKKEKSITQSQALDEAARFFGYSNYKHYLNILDAGSKLKENLLKEIYSEKDILKKKELAIHFIKNFKTLFHEHLDILKMFQDSDYSDTVQTICEKLNLIKDEIQSYMIEDFLTEEGKYEIHSLQPYFIAKEISLSDLAYEIDGDMLSVDGSYELKTKFDFENIIVNEEELKDERFNDRELFGTFEIRIDRNKKFTIVHSDIGEEMKGSFYSASFR